MVKKTHDIFADDYEVYNQEAVHTHILFSNCNVIISKKHGNTNAIIGFEMYQFDANRIDWFDLFYSIKQQSRLLNFNVSQTKLYLLNSDFVLVPDKLFKFQEASDFINGVVKQQIDSSTNIDKINSSTLGFCVYQTDNHIIKLAKTHFNVQQIQHIASPLLQHIFQANNQDVNYQASISMYVDEKNMFYSCISNNQLLISKNISYKQPDDIVYHLLQTMDVYQIPPNQMLLRVEGNVVEQDILHVYLQKFFKHIQFEVDTNQSLRLIKSNRYPDHFFTIVSKLI